MVRKLFAVIFILSTFFSFAQNRKLDSLRNELKKSPKDFYLQVDIINELRIEKDKIALKKEIEQAKIKFKNNEDYYNYFKISDALIPFLEEKSDEANQILDSYSKSINFKKSPNAELLFNYLKANIEKKSGDHQQAEKFYQNCLRILKESKKVDKNRFGNIYINYASSLIALGEYEKALSVLFDLLKIKNFDNLGHVYTNIGICYFNLKQFANAEKYYKLSIKHANRESLVNNTANLAILYLERGDFTNAEKTVSGLDFKKFSSNDSAAVFNVLGEVEKQQKNYGKAIQNFQIVEKIDFKSGQNSYLINDYLAIANLYIEMKDYHSAESYLKKSLSLLEKYQDENAKKEALEYLVELNFKQTKNLEGEKYFAEYRQLLDSINSKIVLENTNALDKKFQTAEKEAKISAQNLAIEKGINHRNLALGSGALILLLSGGGFWLIKNRQKHKELKTQNILFELQQSLNEKELQNLNTQLDPHEIKNFLAYISLEIQEKAPESYRNMIKLFNIMKASLNSNSITDSIENQLQQIDDFLSLEKSTISEKLEYSIENKIENNQLQIPRLMLKNLVENSVKHGIKGKENGGKIMVELVEKDHCICIFVDDNGKGRKRAISTDSGIGTSTYQKLFSTLNQKNKEQATFQIIDKDAGTKVEVKIPVNYKYS